MQITKIITDVLNGFRQTTIHSLSVVPLSSLERNVFANLKGKATNYAEDRVGC